ncbi:MAG: rhodanese-like domain-containing protein [Bacteroidetes bacterium]|nr:rhodanese-like domain-containing protein [Bacteroidota bacterium]
MLDALKSLLGMGPATDYTELMKKGAQIIDVRTPAEFNGGHIKGSVNIPLDNLQKQLAKIKKNQPVITCCASGMRSGAAKQMLQANGYAEVYNGGGWAGLQNKLN